jgi:hypothetical protein
VCVCVGYFQDRVYLQTMILPISASWVVRISRREPLTPSYSFDWLIRGVEDGMQVLAQAWQALYCWATSSALRLQFSILSRAGLPGKVTVTDVTEVKHTWELIIPDKGNKYRGPVWRMCSQSKPAWLRPEEKMEWRWEEIFQGPDCHHRA